jgi:hypothetical protein
MADKDSALGRFALGPVQMIFHSIQHYKRTHQGKLPKRIELHPMVMQDFRNHLQIHHPHYIHSEVARGIFLGVPIVQNPNAEQPRLITHEGSIEYL